MPRIAEGLHRLGSDLINFYLVEDATGVTVVDAGVPAFYDKLEACLTDTGRTWDDVKALVLTHAHFDHVGFAERVRSEHGIPVHVHAADETLAHTQKAPRDGSIVPYLRYPSAWRLIGAMAKAGLPGAPEDRRGDDVRRRRPARRPRPSARDPRAGSHARAASPCTSRGTRRCWWATCCARATR